MGFKVRGKPLALLWNRNRFKEYVKPGAWE